MISPARANRAPMVAGANVPLIASARTGGDSIVSPDLMVIISAAVIPTPTSPQSMRIHPVRLRVFTLML